MSIASFFGHDECAACSPKGQHKVEGRGVATADIVLVVTTPTDNIRIVEDYLNKKNTPYYITYLIHCHGSVPANRLDANIKLCRPLLNADLTKCVNKKVVITLGAKPLKILLNQTGLQHARGTVNRKDDYLVVPTYAPDSVTYTPDNLTKILQDVDKAIEIAITGVIPESAQMKFTIPVDLEEEKKFLHSLMSVPEFVFDVETTYNIKEDDSYIFSDKYRILTVGFALKPGEVTVIQVREDNIKYLKYVMTRSTARKIGHGVKADILFMSVAWGITVAPPFGCTLILHYLGQQTDQGTQSLKDCANEFTDYKKIDIEEWCKANKITRYEDIPFQKMAEYNAADVAITKVLWDKWKDLPDCVKLHDRYMDAIPAFIDMEMAGAAAREESVNTAKTLLESDLATLMQLMYQDPAVKELKLINLLLGNKKQLNDIFEWYAANNGVKLIHTDKAKDVKTDKESLALYATGDKCNFALLLQRYKVIAKFMSTYVTPVMDEWCRDDGRVHSSFNYVGAATGRSSSSRPNFQNIPSRNPKYAKMIKNFFVPDNPDGFIVQFDASQIELRLIGVRANDPFLLDAYNKGIDIHVLNASEGYKVPIEQVTPELRNLSKAAVGFGLNYGRIVSSLAKDLKISIEEATTFRNNYFKRYSGVWQFIQDTTEFVFKNGYVETMYGLKRRFPAVFSRNYDGVVPFLLKEDQKHPYYWEAAAIKREAVNTVIQGTAGQFIVLTAIPEAKKTLDKYKFPVKLFNTVHDSLIFRVEDPACKDDFIGCMGETLDNLPTPFEKVIPFPFDCEIGPVWGTLKKYKKL